MDLVFAQLPLLLFTAIAPMASGAFAGLSNAFLTTDFSPEALRRIDRWTLLPIVILTVGVVLALVFFNSPQAGLFVLQGVDSGAFTFAVVMAAVFAIAAVVYWIVAMAGVMSYGVRKGAAAIMSVLAVAYAVSIGIVYMTSDVATWASGIVPLGFAGFCLASGVPLGALVIAAAGAMRETRGTSFATFSLVTALIGTVVAIFAVTVQLMNAQAMVSAFFAGADILPGAWVYLAIALIGFVVALGCLRGAFSDVRSAAPLGRTAGAAAAMPVYGATDLYDRDRAAERSTVAWLVGSNAAVLVALIVSRVLFYALQV
ncbi:DmsC/YnfH family molybdoenzyme membrane anchor subunit [Arabiibacter massiliensis]|uniref:DmsC/YnfH family molybdoenzyme membrane anchor subunit n=1 Tax=Arabiibacter massiliensis TaxID=1870985 RepID=UPI0009BC2E0B|nr:DmsC/YnfH family molybdoenzyme membrane anchor subunit [Arabiibacter massiliensis]